MDLSVMVVSGNQLWLTEQQSDPHADAVKNILLMRSRKLALKEEELSSLIQAHKRIQDFKVRVIKSTLVEFKNENIEPEMSNPLDINVKHPT